MSDSPKVFNKNSADKPRPGAIYIGRPSRFGNPFVLGKDGNRKMVIDKFEAALVGNATLLAAVKRDLRGKDLVCFCAPLACHGDVLLRIANEDSE